MKHISILILVALCACKSQKLPPERIVEKEVVRTEYVEKLRDTTIYIKIPIESKERFTPDSTSFLKLSYFQSICEIRDGGLFHSIETIPTAIPVDVTVKDTHTQNDSISGNEVTKYISVPAEFTKWEAFYMQIGKITFWAVIIAILIVIGYFVGRKPLKRYLPFK